MNEHVCYVANILARESKEMNGLECLVALIASHIEPKWRDCRHDVVVRMSGSSVVVVRRGEVEKWNSRVAIKT